MTATSIVLQRLLSSAQLAMSISFTIRKRSLRNMLNDKGFCRHSWSLRHSRNKLLGSSRPEVFCKKGVLRNFARFTGKHLCKSFFYSINWPATLLKKKLWHRCFPVNLAKFVKTPFFKEYLRWLLLNCRIHWFLFFSFNWKFDSLSISKLSDRILMHLNL